MQLQQRVMGFMFQWFPSTILLEISSEAEITLTLSDSDLVLKHWSTRSSGSSQHQQHLYGLVWQACSW